MGESVGDAEGISVGEGEGDLVTTGARVAIRWFRLPLPFLPFLLRLLIFIFIFS